MNVFDKPNDQSETCFCFGMARPRSTSRYAVSATKKPFKKKKKEKTAENLVISKKDCTFAPAFVMDA